MKTFKQFIEQKNDVPGVIKSLQGIAQDASKTINPKDVKNKVVNTVFDKLTGGAEGRQKGVEAIQGKLNTMSTDLPKAIDKFQGFLNSGKIEKGMGKLNDKLLKQLK
tara:strand:- start:32 stop:352 length:321 start_codon:yes stop_codon:yes gene_type:complete